MSTEAKHSLGETKMGGSRGPLINLTRDEDAQCFGVAERQSRYRSSPYHQIQIQIQKGGFKGAVYGVSQITRAAHHKEFRITDPSAAGNARCSLTAGQRVLLMLNKRRPLVRDYDVGFHLQILADPTNQKRKERASVLMSKQIRDMRRIIDLTLCLPCLLTR